MKQKIIIIFILISFIFTLTGCWNYKEISEQGIIAGVIFDYDTELKKIDLTVEIVTTTLVQSGTAFKSKIFSEKGDNAFDSVRNIIKKTGRKLLWSHAKVVIFGEDLIKEKQAFSGVMDFLERNAQIRSDVWVLGTMVNPAKDIFLKSKSDIQYVVSFMIDDTLVNEKNVSKFVALPRWQFSEMMASEGVTPTLPLIKLDNDIATLEGEIILQDLSFKGTLNEIETRSKLLVTDKYKGGIMVVNKGANEAPKTKNDLNLALEIRKNNSKIEPRVSDGNIEMNLEVRLNATLVEANEYMDFSKLASLEEVKRFSQNEIKNQVDSVISRMQTEVGTDIFGFGNVLERKYPDLWNQIKDDWNDKFRSIKINTNVNVQIDGTAALAKQTKIKK